MSSGKRRLTTKQKQQIRDDYSFYYLRRIRGILKENIDIEDLDEQEFTENQIKTIDGMLNARRKRRRSGGKRSSWMKRHH